MILEIQSVEIDPGFPRSQLGRRFQTCQNTGDLEVEAEAKRNQIKA